MTLEQFIIEFYLSAAERWYMPRPYIENNLGDSTHMEQRRECVVEATHLWKAMKKYAKEQEA